MKRLPNLDVLRFFLATLVLLFHLPQLSKNQGLPYFDELPIFHRGVEAVYMFFCLSGFLIIRLIYRAKLRNSFFIRDFYVRRILRIFPLYYLVLIFGFLFYNLFLPGVGIPFEIKYNLVEGILLCVFFLPNVFTNLYEPGGILEVLWSIGIEEQFYLFIAPLLFLIPTKRVLMALLIICGFYFFIFHIDTFYYLNKFQAVFFLLLSGGIFAILEENKQLNFLKRSKLVPIIITMITMLFFVSDVFAFQQLWLTNLFLSILFPLFIHSLAFNNFGFEIKNRWLNYFGNISYGIYMYHIIMLNFAVFLFLKLHLGKILGDSLAIILLNALTLGLTLIVSHFSFQYFEKYFLKLKSKFRNDTN